MGNDGELRTGQYLVEEVKAIKCFHPRMLTPLTQGNYATVGSAIVAIAIVGRGG